MVFTPCRCHFRWVALQGVFKLVCKEFHTIMTLTPEGIQAIEGVNEAYHKDYQKSTDSLKSVETSEEFLSLAGNILSGLSDDSKFLRQEAFLAASQDWVSGKLSSSARKQGVFFRVNPRKVILYKSAVILPNGIGRCKFHDRCPWESKKGINLIAVQITKSLKGDYKIKFIASDSEIKMGKTLVDGNARYWETTSVLRNILRDSRMGFTVVARVTEWLRNRKSEIVKKGQATYED